MCGDGGGGGWREGRVNKYVSITILGMDGETRCLITKQRRTHNDTMTLPEDDSSI